MLIYQITDLRKECEIVINEIKYLKLNLCMLNLFCQMIMKGFLNFKLKLATHDNKNVSTVAKLSPSPRSTKLC